MSRLPQQTGYSASEQTYPRGHPDVRQKTVKSNPRGKWHIVREKVGRSSCTCTERTRRFSCGKPSTCSPNNQVNVNWVERSCKPAAQIRHNTVVRERESICVCKQVAARMLLWVHVHVFDLGMPKRTRGVHPSAIIGLAHCNCKTRKRKTWSVEIKVQGNMRR
jgi:hypothetical protein